GQWLWIGRSSGQRALALARDSAAAGGTIIEVPLRHDLVQRRGTVILVSDRLFRVAAPLRRYHERLLAEALGQLPAPVPALRRLLRPAAWIPTVDEVLYAEQVEVPSAYFFADPGPRWKLVLTSFGAVFSAPTLDLHGSIDLALRRSDDLAHGLRFGLFH